MSDIVERLRWRATNTSTPTATTPVLCAEAADEIERLGRDYDTARDAHDRRVRELDAHCVEVARLRAEIERLKAEVSALNHAEVKLLVQVDEQDDEIERLRAALEAWNHAVRIDVLMEGPRYMGVSGEAGKRAWEMTRAALKEDGE